MTNANDFNDVMADYERYRAALRQALETNKAAVFDALAAANITSVTAEFGGEGDSGGIESVSANSGDTSIALSVGRVPVQQAQFGDAAPVATPHTLRGAIEALCYDCLTLVHDGWENNDGAYGTFTFNVAVRTVELEFNGRFTDVATSTHSF
jgi:hypothetical protein